MKMIKINKKMTQEAQLKMERQKKKRLKNKQN